MNKSDVILPPVSREAHERIVREAVAAEREACAQLASRRVCSTAPCKNPRCGVCKEASDIADAIRRRR